MATSTKPLQRFAGGLEGAYGNYIAPDIEIPFIGKEHNQTFGMIEDQSVVGVAQKDLPMKGVRRFVGSFESQLDVLTCEEYFEAAFGANAGGVFTMPTTKNEKSLSLVALDEVKTNKYAGCVINNFMIKSVAEEDLKFSCDLVTNVAEGRDGTAFPAMAVEPGTRVGHQHADGTGYLRIGDQVDALAAGDNVEIVKDINYGFTWNFSESFVNAVGSVQPLSKWCDSSLDFTLVQHDSDSWKAWRDAGTHLQLSAYYYVSATATLLIEVPNFLIEDVDETDAEIPELSIKCRVGRNGRVGDGSDENTNMAFASAIRATVVNS